MCYLYYLFCVAGSQKCYLQFQDCYYFLVPFICRMNISEEMKAENYIMEREESEACMNKIKELLEQFEDEKE